MSTIKKPHVIVFGNEKGGTGKSTLSMHVIVSLLKIGYKVGSIDIDARQGTLTRYIDNRLTTAKRLSSDLLIPEHTAVYKVDGSIREEVEAKETENFKLAFDQIAKNNNFIVIDTPGNDTFLSRLAHSYADTLITPTNDSFIDLDLLVRIESANKVMKPSIYSEMVWEQRKSKLQREHSSIDWIVVRNRLTNISSKNKAEMVQILMELSKRIGFRVASGFAERVVFKELFLSGLTLLDVEDNRAMLSLSHIAARQELRDLLKMLNLPTLNKKIENVA